MNKFTAYKNMFWMVLAVAGAGLMNVRASAIDTLDAALWEDSEWISAADASVFDGKVQEGARAADGASGEGIPRYQFAGLWMVPVASVRITGSWLAARSDVRMRL